MNSFLSRYAKSILILVGILGGSAFLFSRYYISAKIEREKEITRKSIKNEEVTKVVTANTNFSFQLWQETLKERNNKNLFISPSSVAMALQMTYNGSKGDTKTAMAKVLGLEKIDLKSLNQANTALQRSLNYNDSDLQIYSINSLWVNNELKLTKEFQNTAETFYQGQFKTLNFADTNTPNIINDWIRNATQDKISNMVGSIKPNTQLFLINAVYFDGAWKNNFDKKNTSEERGFNLINGQTKIIPLMYQKRVFNYYENEQFQAIRLPYRGDDFSMYIFLPLPHSNLKTFYQNLNGKNWLNWLQLIKKNNKVVELYLPRFKIEDEIKFNDILKQLGMGVAFDKNQSDFSGIGETQSHNNLYINEVLQKTFVNVNEEGTKAAAVTKVEHEAKAIPVTMIVDRPFFFVIKSDLTDTILFMGSIVEPK